MKHSLENLILSKEKLLFSEAILELKPYVGDISHFRAVRFLLQCAQNGELKVYFKSNILGYPSDKKKVDHPDPNDFVLMSSVPTGADVTRVTPPNGKTNGETKREIRFLSGSYEDKQEKPFFVSVSQFQQNGINYDSVEERSCEAIHPTDHLEELFYIYRKDLLEFIESNPNNDNKNTSKNRKDLQSDEAESNNNKFSVFHDMDRLSYDEVTFTFIAGDMIEIEARRKKCKVGYELLSLKNMTTGKLNNAGLMLLSFALNKKVPVNKNNIKHKQKLKKAINCTLGLKGDPMLSIDEQSKYYEKYFHAQDERSRADDRAKEKTERNLFDRNEDYQSIKSRELDAQADRLLEQNDDENSS